jgi:hypothetical protein
MNINLNLPPIIIDKGIGENKCYLFSATESKDFQVEELSV